ncbi:EAL domain-containing protein (putative c-di-GMP-specific phosphodiesterase class I) [Tamilnaduibacter salinus]|uniref:EAL domain-containing protein (Putative c-di-GMP-specific phosphodiesterase class I) n=1 Tax=Tamilnaduibacter salinus TaxID=1484056 RepID=A0A2U1CXN3_9GAMM|nr:GGDEF domain-containing phosphodiesterase [Tamilnaduibacter salinus]PVY77004.1 EAL domain-containing protein (putative c-di-GMP-specific phosphodiesterase class I) [Tamilnaduibacter salinus]
MADSEKALRASINRIADQLCQAVDGNYDFHVNASSDDLDIQKLSVLSNFVLESVRRNLTELEGVRHDLQQRVEDRTRQLDRIIKGANDGVWEWDLASNELTVSERWRTMSGCEHWPGTFDADAWLARMHPEDRGPFRTAVLQHTSGVSERFSAQYRLENGRGGFRWMVARGICDHDPASGEPRLMAGTQSDITEQKFVHSASGLANKDYLRLVLQHRLAPPDGPAPSLIVIRLSNLPLVRENLRSQEEGELGAAIRRRLETCMVPSDLVARLVDGTPAMLVHQTDAQELEQRACTVLQAFDEPVTLSRRSVWLTASIGIVQSHETVGRDADAMLQGAHTLLRHMRQRATGHITFFQRSMHNEHARRLESEQLLRDALAQLWVEPFLQPLVDTVRGTITGFEALCRIRHPETGLVSPGEFIPVAEETGLIHPLSLQLLDQILPLLSDSRMTERYGNAFYISFNLSPVQLQDPHMGEEILERLRHSGVSPERLNIELTETAVMGDANTAIEIMERFATAGFAISLDDFGAGYSSLGLIRSLPLQQVKIDRSLVSSVDTDDEKRAILNMILSLCEQLDLTAVVEGVETETELACLAGMGAQLVQGFLFSRPLPPETLLDQVPPRGLLSAAGS